MLAVTDFQEHRWIGFRSWRSRLWTCLSCFSWSYRREDWSKWLTRNSGERSRKDSIFHRLSQAQPSRSEHSQSIHPNLFFIHHIAITVDNGSIIHSFMHSFILETYIAPLQDTTTQGRSQPSQGQGRRTWGRCKILKGRSSARNAAQQGDHSRPMGSPPKRPFAAYQLNVPEGPRAYYENLKFNLSLSCTVLL